MWKIVLLFFVFEGDKLIQVVEPVAGATYKTMEDCHRVAAKMKALNPLPPAYKVLHGCIDPSTGATERR